MADKPKRGLLGKLGDAFFTSDDSSQGDQAGATAAKPATSSGTSDSPIVPRISMPHRSVLPPGAVDPTMYAEVAKALDEQVRSPVLSAFLAQVEALSEDIPDALTRYRVSLKTVATSNGVDKLAVLREVEQAVGSRIQALENERRNGEQEFASTEQTQLTAATQRREAIRQRVSDLRAEVGRLQSEETDLDRQIESVTTQMNEARGKFAAACDKHAAGLLDLQSKVGAIKA